MNFLNSKELRKTWIDFYEKRGHADCGAVSLVGDGSTGVLFNVAGMQPLMPYLLGKEHPLGKRLCNVQGCIRTIDIDSVGDPSHATFFEMMGSWSFGDYFKEDRCKWSYELLTEVFGIPQDRIAATVFEGDANAPRDEEAAKLRELSGIKKENIYFLPKKDNWWELDRGPSGPCSEMFYITDKAPCGEDCNPGCDCGRFVEVGNDVFMQYDKVDDDKYIPLANKNVDTGWGLERILMFLNGKGDIYTLDLFAGIIKYLEEKSGKEYLSDEETTKAMRIVADHIRTSVMLIGDEAKLTPSNVGAGYILRRLIRRAVRYAKILSVSNEDLYNCASIYINDVYNEVYPNLKEFEKMILGVLKSEMMKFEKLVLSGFKEFEKMTSKLAGNTISGKEAFRLFDTFGFPIEMTIEEAEQKGLTVDKEGFKKAFAEHQEKSRAVPKGEFKSGLADDGEATVKYHTATHLLNAALKKVVGDSSHQEGSNINSERLRFDFACDHKLTDEEKKQTEDIINGWIKEELQVSFVEMPKEKAVEIGAEHQFIERYPDIVKVYDIGEISKEICTGPHVTNTKELGKFRIKKEEASSSGVRRIKAVLE